MMCCRIAPLRSKPPDSLVTSAGVFRVMAFATFGEVHGNAEVFSLGIGGGFHLYDDGVMLAFRQTPTPWWPDLAAASRPRAHPADAPECRRWRESH